MNKTARGGRRGGWRASVGPRGPRREGAVPLLVVASRLGASAHRRARARGGVWPGEARGSGAWGEWRRIGLVRLAPVARVPSHAGSGGRRRHPCGGATARLPARVRWLRRAIRLTLTEGGRRPLPSGERAATARRPGGGGRWRRLVGAPSSATSGHLLRAAPASIVFFPLSPCFSFPPPALPFSFFPIPPPPIFFAFPSPHLVLLRPPPPPLSSSLPVAFFFWISPS